MTPGLWYIDGFGALQAIICPSAYSSAVFGCLGKVYCKDCQSKRGD